MHAIIYFIGCCVVGHFIVRISYVATHRCGQWIGDKLDEFNSWESRRRIERLTRNLPGWKAPQPAPESAEQRSERLAKIDEAAAIRRYATFPDHQVPPEYKERVAALHKVWMAQGHLDQF
jgi:hypothetical protein